MLTTNQNLQQGRYRIVSQIKQNGAEASYEAFDNELGAQVLVKEIRSSLGNVATSAQAEAQALNFAEKAKVLTEMNHESLLVVRDFFSETDNHYLVTEFPGGTTLAELLEKNKKPFVAGEVAGWANDLLGALNYLHTLMPPIVHGEVKPQNIRLSADGKKAKLVISNLVKSADEVKAATRNQTFDAAVLPYLALEQIWQGLDSASKKVILTNYDDRSEKILEQPTDARTDLFSLAACLYYLLTAQAPADALTRSIDILEGKADPLQSPTRLNPAIPQEVSDVLLKALEIRRENRFSSAVIMRQVLRTAFARVQERAGSSSAVKPSPKEDDFLLEIPVTETISVVSAPAAAPKTPEIESEQARQLELIKRQLREAEERRLEAERRAAEAEKRLFEAEKTIHETPTTISLSADEMKKEMSIAAAYQPTSEDLPSLFADAPKEGGGFKKIVAAAVALIVLGGGGFGIWTVTQSKSGVPNPAVTSINSDVSTPPAENKPAVSGEPTPGTNEQATVQDSQPADSPATETEVPAENPGLAKPKRVTPNTPQVAEVKKPAPTPAKKAETPKKVTLDDLLKDN